MVKNRFKLARILAVMLVAILFSSCIFVRCDGIGGIAGNGNKKTERRELSDFKEVSIDGVGSVEIKIGDKFSVEVSADENLLPFLRTDVKSERLVIHQEKTISAKHGPHYVVTTKGLNLIRASGATSVRASDLNTEKLSVTESGVGGMHLAGSAKELVVDLSGAGSIDAYLLRAENVDATVSGVGSLKVNAEKTLKATVSGTGSIHYRGSPTVQSHVSGIGSVSHE